MKILTSEEIREADEHTILHEPVSSLGLMERAGEACFRWIIANTENSLMHTVICCRGNNGGDGLVIARMLAQRKFPVEVLVLMTGQPSADFRSNYEAALKTGVTISEIQEGVPLQLTTGRIIIDAMFGSGLSRPVDGWLGSCIEAINASGSEIISIDLPSGMFADRHSEGAIVKASHTLTFECPKLAFFFRENASCTGQFHVLPVGLDSAFISRTKSLKFYLTKSDVAQLIRKREKFSHKGDYGKSLIISGSKGKMGAAILAARACLRSGTGLLTMHVPACGYEIMQTAVPEAMVEVDKDEMIITDVFEGDYDAIGIGPGIGLAAETSDMLSKVLSYAGSPVVLDADALNLISANKENMSLIPEHSILTPHPKEFLRLAGDSRHDFERHEMQLKLSEQFKIYIVLKGAHTCITTPDGKAYFNSTGNPGMARGGSGDVLTGMITAFLAQGYHPEQAAVISVFLHGLAGDIAAKRKGVYSMTAGDIIDNIPRAFRKLLKP